MSIVKARRGNEICIRGSEFEISRQLSSDQPETGDQRLELYNQKKMMHSKSQQKVKSWGNTLLGQRKKKLLSLEEKAAIAEEERVAIDKEWAIIQAEERNRSIERARNLQKMESQRYKSLHSQLLLQSVLMERDLQIERKNKAIQMSRQKSDIVATNPFLKSSQEEAQQLEIDRINRIQIADYQKSQTDIKKGLEKRQKQADFEYYVNLNKDNSREIKQIKENDSANTRNFKESYGKALQEIIQGKKDRLSKEIQNGKLLDLENEKFEKRKAYISSKHKELNRLRFSNQDNIYDQIAKLGYNSDLEKKNKIEEFIEKGVEAHLNDGVDRAIKEKESRESYLKEIEQFRKEQLDIKKHKRAVAHQEEKEYKEQIDQAYAQHVKQTRSTLEQKNANNLHYRELQLEQINRKIQDYESAKEKARLEHLKDAQKEQAEDSEFDAYSKSIQDEWIQAGRPTRLISHSIQKLKQHKIPKERFVEGIKLDTFARLGFS